MSAPSDIVNELRARGVELHANGDRLLFRPRDRVTPDMLARLRAAKPALLEFLRSDPLDDLGVQTAQREAKHMGEASKTAGDSNAGARWVVGTRLEPLHESLQGLVMTRSGWTPESWVAYLKRRARLCDERHGDWAALYTQAFQLLESGNGNHMA